MAGQTAMLVCSLWQTGGPAYHIGASIGLAEVCQVYDAALADGRERTDSQRRGQ